MSVYFALKCNSCAPRVNRASFEEVTLILEKQSNEDTIWAIAGWVEKNVPEHQFGYAYSKLPQLAVEVLAEHSSNAALQELMVNFGDDPGAHAAAMHQSLFYVAKAYCKYSSVYPKQWLEMYQEDVIKEQAYLEVARVAVENEERKFLASVDVMAVMA